METMPIKYVKGDATKPAGEKTKIIVHICNDVGGWGKGFVVAISKRWKQPEAAYRQWCNEKEMAQTDEIRFEELESSEGKRFGLGHVQFVKAEQDIWVANMIAQRNIRPDSEGNPPIRYAAVSECLKRVRKFAGHENAAIHMPRIGCGLAGGKWTEIEKIITGELSAYGIEVTVYDFE